MTSGPGRCFGRRSGCKVGALLPLVLEPQVPPLGQLPKTAWRAHPRRRRAGDPGSASSPVRGHPAPAAPGERRARQPGAVPGPAGPSPQRCLFQECPPSGPAASLTAQERRPCRAPFSTLDCLRTRPVHKAVSARAEKPRSVHHPHPVTRRSQAQMCLGGQRSRGSERGRKSREGLHHGLVRVCS